MRKLKAIYGCVENAPVGKSIRFMMHTLFDDIITIYKVYTADLVICYLLVGKHQSYLQNKRWGKKSVLGTEKKSLGISLSSRSENKQAKQSANHFFHRKKKTGQKIQPSFVCRTLRGSSNFTVLH